jgi:quercetin dioxygenase-like cupin family protein
MRTHRPGGETTARTADDRYRRMLIETPLMRAGMLGFPAGERIPWHHHRESDELFQVIGGAATFHVGEETVDAVAGDTVLVGAGVAHAIAVADDAPLVLLAVVSPNLQDHAWLAGPDGDVVDTPVLP